MRPDEIMENLDPEQRRAVEYDGGDLLVSAPPGSGKTRVLAARFTRLAKEYGPARVLAVTFTNRAAGEMLSRVEGLVGPSGGGLNVGTFHAFCLGFLKEKAPDLRLLGRSDQEALLRELGEGKPRKAAEKISAARGFSVEDNPVDDIGTEELLRRYEERLAELGAVDLDGLILDTIEALDEDGGEDGPGLFAHVLVDEYQDINPAQRRLVRLLRGGHGYVTAIGDPDQSIYGFRGASPGAFEDFLSDYPGSEMVELVRNYRSLANIVDCSASVAAGNPDRPERTVESVSPGGEVRVVDTPTGVSGVDYVAEEIERLMGGLSSRTVSGGGRGGGEWCFSGFAVLARTNSLASELAERFARTSIPFRLVGPPRPGAEEFAGVLRERGAGEDEYLADILAEAADGEGLDDEVLAAFDSGLRVYEARTGGPARGPVSLAEFTEGMLLSSPSDCCEFKADRVSIMTMHATKGLEWRCVFVCGVEDGLVPFRVGGRCDDAAEERRLFFVAMTRAAERLYLVSSRTRVVHGCPAERAPSPFLDDLPSGLVEAVTVRKKKRKRRAVQEGLFD